MTLPDAPIAEEGFFVTYFLTVADQARSKEFYAGVLGGKVVSDADPSYIKLANSWIGSFSMAVAGRRPTSLEYCWRRPVISTTSAAF